MKVLERLYTGYMRRGRSPASRLYSTPAGVSRAHRWCYIVVAWVQAILDS
jgi:hypothetical protein